MGKGLTVMGSVVVTMVIALGVTWLPDALEDAEFFRVTEVTVQGTHYLHEARVKELLDLPPGASVWGDLEAWAARVRRHVLVEDAFVHRRLPDRLEVEVRERRPVALHPSPVLVPVDRKGRVLPLDLMEHRLDLPIILPPPGAIHGTADLEGVEEADPARIRSLAREVARLSEADPGFMALVSEVGMDSAGDMLLHLADPRAVIHYRGLASPHELRRSLRLLEHARGFREGEVPAVVDLRFDDRAILRFAEIEGVL